jgi:tetraacyldisaccharide 4'-kinase
MHWYLFPFSFLYWSIAATRNKFFDWGWIKSKSFVVPIISVGNITVGGTGKTPHIEYLIRFLSEKFTVATISRGYKRKTKGFVEVTSQSKASQVGDEPLQIKQKYQKTRVIVDEKRVNAVEKLIAEKKTPEVILLDDAYQHRHIVPGLNILLIDYNKPLSNDYILPVGRLRESASHTSRANIVIVTKCPVNLNPIDFRIRSKDLNLFPYQSLFFTTFTYNSIKPLFTFQTKFKCINDLRGVETLVVTGIANPEPMYKKLESVGAKITKLEFKDHHEFKAADIHKISKAFMAINDKNKAIICTEKDAVRFKTGSFVKEISKLPMYSLPIEVSFLNNDEDKFKNLLEKFITCKTLKTS